MNKLRFAILDQFSGNSSGCHSAVDFMMNEIIEVYPKAFFDLYTIGFPNNNKYFPNHSEHLKNISMNPWWGSINFIGLPILFNIPKANVVVFRGGGLFDKKIYNPLYSYLLNYFFVFPYIKLLKKPIIAYSIGVGPFNTKFGRWMAKNVLRKIDLLVVRDNGSKRIINNLNIKVDAVLADPVYNLKCINNIEEILEKIKLSKNGKYLGLNVTPITNLMKSRRRKDNVNKNDLVNNIIEMIDRIYSEFQIETILFPTDTEYGIFHEIQNSANSPVHYVDREIYSPYELAAIMGICKCFIGMRMHSLILALSQYVPTIGIVYNDKVRYILEDSNMKDKVFEINEVVNDPNKLYKKIVSIFNNYKREYSFTKENIIPMQEKAKQMPAKLKEFLDEYFK